MVGEGCAHCKQVGAKWRYGGSGRNGRVGVVCEKVAWHGSSAIWEGRVAGEMCGVQCGAGRYAACCFAARNAPGTRAPPGAYVFGALQVYALVCACCTKGAFRRWRQAEEPPAVAEGVRQCYVAQRRSSARAAR